MLNRDCKVRPIQRYLKSLGKDITVYIGIAADEPKRLARLKDNRISLLDKYGYTEQMAYDLCKKYNLLSPIYKTGTRGGCWFCPNAKISSLSHLRKKHPDLWRKLEELSRIPNLCSYGFKYGQTVQEVALKLNKYDMKHRGINIRCTQLSLFNPEPDTNVGGVTCSLEHTKAKRAKWRIYFKNGNCRDVCGWCVKQFQAGGSNAAIVERIEKLTKKLIKDDSIKFI